MDREGVAVFLEAPCKHEATPARPRDRAGVSDSRARHVPGMGSYSTRSARGIPNVAVEPPAEIVRGSVLVSSDTK